MANNLSNSNIETRTSWVGWVYFAGILMIIIGVLQSIAGLAALLNNNFYLVNHGDLVVFDITAWGWIHLILGIVILAASNAVFSGRVWGRTIGVILAMASLIDNFIFLPAYPVWSITMMILCLLFIYALTVHGREVQL
jgi:hypothetical protein